MTEFIIVFLICATIWHYIYDGILLPSFRLNLRYKLFQKRDKLRSLKLKYDNEIDPQIFKHIDYSICSAIKNLSAFNLFIVAQAVRGMSLDPKLKLKIDEREALIESCEIRDVYWIHQSVPKYIFLALVANHGGWMIYLFPIFILFVAIVLVLDLYKSLNQMIRRIFKEVSFFPETLISNVYLGYKESYV